MSASIDGISMESVYLTEEPVPAFVLRQSRDHIQFGMMALSAAFLLMALANFLCMKRAGWPVVRWALAITNVLIVYVDMVMFLGTIQSIRRVRRGPQYLKLTPFGILSTNYGSTFYVPWDALEAVFCVGKNRQALISIRIKNPKAVPSLKPYLKVMRQYRRWFNWDWAFSLNAYEARIEIVKTALLYFYTYPEKRAEIGFESGLASLHEAVSQKWNMPISTVPIAAPDERS